MHDQWVLSRDETAIIKHGSVGYLTGPSGIGKTRLLSQLAVAIATGNPVLGFDRQSPGSVVVATANQQELRDHLALQTTTLTQQQTMTLVEHLTIMPLLRPPEGRCSDEDRRIMAGITLRTLVQNLRNYATDRGWTAIMFDSFEAWSLTHTFLEELTEMPGHPAVIAVHQDRLLGVDWAIDLEPRETGAVVMHIRKEPQLSTILARNALGIFVRQPAFLVRA